MQNQRMNILWLENKWICLYFQNNLLDVLRIKEKITGDTFYQDAGTILFRFFPLPNYFSNICGICYFGLQITLKQTNTQPQCLEF